MHLRTTHTDLDYTISIKKTKGSLKLHLVVEDTQDNFEHFAENYYLFGYRTRTAFVADASKRTLDEIYKFSDAPRPVLPSASGTLYVPTLSRDKVTCVEAESVTSLDETLAQGCKDDNDLLVTLVGAGYVEDTGDRVYDVGTRLAVVKPVIFFRAPKNMRYSALLGWQPLKSRPLRLLLLASCIRGARQYFSDDPVSVSDIMTFTTEFQSLLFAGHKS
jgi:hypothetical protein